MQFFCYNWTVSVYCRRTTLQLPTLLTGDTEEGTGTIMAQLGLALALVSTFNGSNSQIE